MLCYSVTYIVLFSDWLGASQLTNQLQAAIDFLRFGLVIIEDNQNIETVTNCRASIKQITNNKYQDIKISDE